MTLPSGRRPASPSLSSARPVAIVTGASSGIGAATALRLAADGYDVHAGARRVDRMAALAERGIRVHALDLTDDASMKSLVEEVLGEHGRIDALVNNAGYGAYGAFEEVPLAEARRQIEVNLFGLARLTQLVVPTMRAQRRGTIVNVSSIGGKITTPLGSWYHASKFAVEGLSDALRLELGGFGVRVVVIEPGAIATEWGGIARDSAIAASADGPYGRMVTSAMATLAGSESTGRASSPEVVADAISRAVRARRPRTRYAVGSGARPILLVRRIASDRMFDRLVARAFLGRPTARATS
ncbi:oxidoreductase [Microbacterium sp. CJ88]|uniref:oxidoreductase n=1 Tax=Microbacterium sp. CJ88 TaxID=3445672 RepID=UPI003F65CABF